MNDCAALWEQNNEKLKWKPTFIFESLLSVSPGLTTVSQNIFFPAVFTHFIRRIYRNEWSVCGRNGDGPVINAAEVGGARDRSASWPGLFKRAWRHRRPFPLSPGPPSLSNKQLNIHS